MDTYAQILSSLPLTAFKINTAETAFVDITGRGVTLSATPTLVSALTSGAKKAMLVGTTGVNFPTTIFVRGQEKRSFALRATILPTDTTANAQAILSHNSAYDGLILSSGQVRFVVEFNTLGTVTAAYDIPENFQAMDVVATYEPGAIKLFINGELAQQTSVSTEQIKDGSKVRASNNLYIGQTASGTKNVIVDAVAVYARVLSEAEVYMQTLMGDRVISSEVVTAPYRPIVFDGTGANVYYPKTWTAGNWDDVASASNVSLVSDNLVPEIEYTTQLSKAGVWIGSYDVPPTDAFANIYGVKLEWVGAGSFTVETSINGGSSWQTATSGRQLAGTFNWAPTGVPVLIRVTFTGGIASDTSYLSSMTVTSYLSADVLSSDSSRKITETALTTTSDASLEPIVRKRFGGITSFGSTQTISADLDGTTTRPLTGIEMWVRFDTIVTGTYLFDNRPAGGTTFLWLTNSPIRFVYPSGTLYVNGVSTATNTFAPVAGVDYHLFYVAPATTTTAYTLTGTSNVIKSYKMIKIYTANPTAAQIASIFAAYSLYPTNRLASDAVTVGEPATPFKGYSYNWSLSSAV